MGTTLISLCFVFREGRGKWAYTSRRKREWGRRYLRFGWPSIILLTDCAFCLLLALEWGGSKYPWSDARIISALVVCVFLLLVLMVRLQPTLFAILNSSLKRLGLTPRPANPPSAMLRLVTLPSIVLQLFIIPISLRPPVEEEPTGEPEPPSPGDLIHEFPHSRTHSAAPLPSNRDYRPLSGWISGYILPAMTIGASVQVISTYVSEVSDGRCVSTN